MANKLQLRIYSKDVMISMEKSETMPQCLLPLSTQTMIANLLTLVFVHATTNIHLVLLISTTYMYDKDILKWDTVEEGGNILHTVHLQYIIFSN